MSVALGFFLKLSLQLVQVLESREHNLFTCLFDFSRKKHFVEDRIDLRRFSSAYVSLCGSDRSTPEHLSAPDSLPNKSPRTL